MNVKRHTELSIIPQELCLLLSHAVYGIQENESVSPFKLTFNLLTRSAISLSITVSLYQTFLFSTYSPCLTCSFPECVCACCGNQISQWGNRPIILTEWSIVNMQNVVVFCVCDGWGRGTKYTVCIKIIMSIPTRIANQMCVLRLCVICP